jgi:ATP-dependent Clp endopeptidase proteolytic subunit ClpP
MSKKHKDNDSGWEWFDHNLDLASRTIYMGSLGYSYEGGESGVDHLMSEYFIKGMHLLESRKSDDEIRILMNNPGGDWYHGMAIYDAIRNSKCHCTIKVYGHAMSMGSIILQAADHRIMMPNSRFMIHYGYNGLSGHTKIFEKWAEEGKKINYTMENIYLESIMEKEDYEGNGYIAKVLSDIINRQRSFEIPKAQEVKYSFSKNSSKKREEIRMVLKEMLNFDTILTARETVNLGLADEVFGEDI